MKFRVYGTQKGAALLRLDLLCLIKPAFFCIILTPRLYSGYDSLR